MKFTKIFTLTAALLGTVTLGAQHKSTVTINGAQADGTIIPKEIYGQFSEHLGSCIYGGLWVGKDSDIPNEDGYRLDVLNALKNLQVPVMRWPGGCFADDYHWRDGIGPQSERPYISNNNWGGTLEDNSFGTHEFLNLCEKLGCEPYISGNVGSGTVEELAKWVEYMTSDAHSTMADLRRKNGREEPWKVKYLGIGNECWGCGGQMRPEHYVDVYRQFAGYCRNYGENRLYKIASGPSDYDYNWSETLIKGIGSNMNGMSLHYYAVRDWNKSKGSATVFGEEDYYLTLAKALDIETPIKAHIAILDRYNPEGNVDLLVDEWGTWWDVEPGTNPGHLFQQSTMRDAIVASLSLDIFHKYTRRVKMANIAQVVNVLQAMVLTKGDQMILTPTYHVFEMYKVHQDAEFLPVSYNTDANAVGVGESVPCLSVTASRKDGAVNVDFTNTDLKNSNEITLTWTNLGIDPKNANVEARILTADKVTDYNEFGKPAKVAPKEFKKIKTSKDGITFTLPAMSIVAVSIK